MLGFRRLQLQRMGNALLPVSRMYQKLSAGNTDEAIQRLNISVNERWREVIFLRVAPQWAPLRDDPRFLPLIEKVGLPDPQQSASR